MVVVGKDRVVYGKARKDGKSYKEWMLETTPLDLSRIHFTGTLPYPDYLQALQASSVHVYLTRPRKARATIVDHYDLAKLLPQQIQWLLNDGVDLSQSKGFGSVAKPASHRGKRGKRKQKSLKSALKSA